MLKHCEDLRVNLVDLEELVICKTRYQRIEGIANRVETIDIFFESISNIIYKRLKRYIIVCLFKTLKKIKKKSENICKGKAKSEGS